YRRKVCGWMPYISATAEIMYAPLDRRLVTSSLAALGISPAVSRFAHARKPAQHVRAFGPTLGGHASVTRLPFFAETSNCRSKQLLPYPAQTERTGRQM